MFIRFVVVAMLAVSLLPTAGSAQTAAELLQKGISTQQTAGNLDGAIQLYQQAIAMAGADRATAARAQMQLVSAFLLKGDLPSAAREFNALTVNFGDQKEVVMALAAGMRTAGSMVLAQANSPTRSPTRGTLENGVYHNTATGVEIRLLDGWSIVGDAGSPDGGDSVMVKDSGGQSYLVWMMSEKLSAAELPDALEFSMNQKIHQRTVAGIKDFKAREDTIYKYHGGSAIGGGLRDALAVAFQFNRNGTQTVEYDTWVRTEKTAVFFSRNGPAPTVAAMHTGVETLVFRTDIP